MEDGIIPINKRTGEFTPTKFQGSKGAAIIEFSGPYLKPYTRDIYQYDVRMYTGSGSSFEVSEITGVSESVARRLAMDYAKDIRTARSERSIKERTEYFKAEYFTRESGRTGVLLENLAKDTGMAQIFKKGLAGHLSPTAQKDFDALVFMADKISKIDSIANEFYEDVRTELNIIAKKYELWKSNFSAIDSGFSMEDVKEIEKNLRKIVKKARKAYMKASKVDESQRIGVKSILNKMNKDEAFLEGTEASNKKGRKLKTRQIKW